MTKQEIYEQIVRLTSELHATNVAEKIFSAAKEGNPKKVKGIFDTFKKENLDLYKKILSFRQDYNQYIEERKPVTMLETDIFVDSVFTFDTDIIDSISFTALTILAKIDDHYMFNWNSISAKRYLNVMRSVNENLADFIQTYSFIRWVKENPEDTLSEVLVDVFTGKI